MKDRQKKARKTKRKREEGQKQRKKKQGQRESEKERTRPNEHEEKDARGTLADSGDTRMFAEGMNHELSRLKVEPKAGELCRKWVLENATWQMRAQQILEAVESVR